MNIVGLEGYLKDGPPIDTSWVARISHTQDPLVRARVFSRLLREGEISSAELDEVQAEGATMRPSAEDALGRVRVGTDVIAVIATTREGASKAVLSES